jgi:hypothetical protein
MMSTTGQLLLAGLPTSSMSGSAPGQLVNLAPPLPAFDSAPVFDWGGGQLQKKSKQVELSGSQEGRGSNTGGLLAAVWEGSPAATDGGSGGSKQEQITSHKVELLDLASMDDDQSPTGTSACSDRLSPAKDSAAPDAASGNGSAGPAVRSKQGGLDSANSGSIPNTPSAGQTQPTTQLTAGDDGACPLDVSHTMISSSQQQVYRRSASGLRLRRTISSNAGGEGAVAPVSPVGPGSAPPQPLRQPPSPIGSVPSSPNSG